MAPLKAVTLPKLKPFKLTMQIPTEHQTQSAFINWLRIYEKHYPELRLGFAVPNGGARNIVTACKLKAEGVRSGIPDYMLPFPRGGYSGLAIEFKRERTGKLSDTQIAYIEQLEREGKWLVHVLTDWHAATEVVLGYLALPKPAAA